MRSGTTNGTKVQLYHRNGTNAQAWRANGSQLLNVASGKCLDAPRTRPGDGTRPRIWDCTGGANQQWSVRRFSREPDR
jgi:hypothetical protein